MDEILLRLVDKQYAEITDLEQECRTLNDALDLAAALVASWKAASRKHERRAKEHYRRVQELERQR